MLMKKEVIEDNENLKKEIKDLKKQLEEEKKAYNQIYNRNQKAIEYIENLTFYWNFDEEITSFAFNFLYEKKGRELLEILKGEDKE